MNLYKIIFKHYAQRGSEEGIFTYLVAKSDEEVYEWLKNNPELRDGRAIYTVYSGREEDCKDEMFNIYDNYYNVIGQETFKERIIRLKGLLFDDDEELNDLYYGATLEGWVLISEEVASHDIERLQKLGISIDFA